MKWLLVPEFSTSTSFHWLVWLKLQTSWQLVYNRKSITISWFKLIVALFSSVRCSPVKICKSWVNSLSIDFKLLIIDMIMYSESMHDLNATILKEMSETVSLFRTNWSFCEGSKKTISSMFSRFVLRRKPVRTSNK